MDMCFHVTNLDMCRIGFVSSKNNPQTQKNTWMEKTNVLLLQHS